MSQVTDRLVDEHESALETFSVMMLALSPGG
jgi:hypothetical protein